MSAPEARAVGPLARHDSGPVFDEPWQAQVFLNTPHGKPVVLATVESRASTTE